MLLALALAGGLYAYRARFFAKKSIFSSKSHGLEEAADEASFGAENPLGGVRVGAAVASTAAAAVAAKTDSTAAVTDLVASQFFSSRSIPAQNSSRSIFSSSPIDFDTLRSIEISSRDIKLGIKGEMEGERGEMMSEKLSPEKNKKSEGKAGDFSADEDEEDEEEVDHLSALPMPSASRPVSTMSLPRGVAFSVPPRGEGGRGGEVFPSSADETAAQSDVDVAVAEIVKENATLRRALSIRIMADAAAAAEPPRATFWQRLGAWLMGRDSAVADPWGAWLMGRGSAVADPVGSDVAPTLAPIAAMLAGAAALSSFRDNPLLRAREHEATARLNASLEARISAFEAADVARAYSPAAPSSKPSTITTLPHAMYSSFRAGVNSTDSSFRGVRA